MVVVLGAYESSCGLVSVVDGRWMDTFVIRCFFYAVNRPAKLFYKLIDLCPISRYNFDYGLLSHGPCCNSVQLARGTLCCQLVCNGLAERDKLLHLPPVVVIA